MFVSILYIIAIGLNAYGIYLNTRYNKKRFHRYALLILFLGLLSILISYIVSICYPYQLHRSTAFPISMLYGAAFLCVFLVSLGKQVRRVWLHFLPFCITFIGYLAMMLYPPWRYHYYHEFYIGLYAASAILFITYILAIGIGFYSGPDYCLRTFVKTGKKFLIPLSMTVFIVGIMIIVDIKPGDLQAYLTFSLLFYILALLPIVRLSLPTSETKRHREQVYSRDLRSDTTDVSAIEEVLVEVRTPFLIPKNSELSYRLEIEKFIASKAYLDIDLNKNRFCESINIPKAHVSPFLKQAYGKNFNGFINELRLAYAAKELRREELIYTIDDLSFICGFRSRASFYRNFIAAFGCPPHQYRAIETAH